MNNIALVYTDVRQHLRIAAPLAHALGDHCRLVLLGPDLPPDAAADWPGPCLVDVVSLDAPAVRFGPRTARIFWRGLSLTRALEQQLEHLRQASAAKRFVVVFNDTGIAQRYLIDRANRLGIQTVLIQDGLTETQHRESTPGFAFKQAVTRMFLMPLGLGHFGSSRYGTAGAVMVLADGPSAVAFFQQRAPQARVVQSGLLRPSVPGDGNLAAPPHILFWAVDFLGGLSHPQHHEQQLATLAALAAALEQSAPAVRLQVRLHPGDAPHFPDFHARLGSFKQVDLVDPQIHRDPFAAGLPLLSMSLQSAGIFDALAARVPSFFLDAGLALGPAWAPPALVLADLPACEAMVRRMLADPAAAQAIWHEQTTALWPFILIPYDVACIRDAFA